MLIDAHQDIAYAAWAMGRDFLQSALAKRTHEAASQPGQSEDVCTVGLPEVEQAGIGALIGSIFVEPAASSSARADFHYTTPEQANAQARRQLQYYHSLAQSPRIALITERAGLAELEAARLSRPRTGVMIGMEGAAPILTPDEVWWWREQGVRLIGLAWSYGNQYCGGNKAPGPLRGEAKALLQTIEQAGLILDVSHLAEQSFWQALDLFHGRVVATHANCRSLVSGERQLSDEMIRAIAGRGGIIGVVLYNVFLKDGWQRQHGKAAVTLADAVRHIDHICQITGNANHAGIGSDLDGGFGQEAIPAEMDTIADLPRLGAALGGAGFSAADLKAVMGDNWLRYVRTSLP